jgi:hypothetical protein
MRPRDPGALGRLSFSFPERPERERQTRQSGAWQDLATNLAASMTSTYSSSGILQGHEPPTSATLSVSLTTQPHWPWSTGVKKKKKEKAKILPVDGADT